MNKETTTHNKQFKIKQICMSNPLINFNGSITPRPCTVTDFAIVYGVDRRTLGIWLKPFANEIGERKTYYFTQKQVELIFEHLGQPREFDFERWAMVA
jgi:hypothetical protein